MTPIPWVWLVKRMKRTIRAVDTETATKDNLFLLFSGIGEEYSQSQYTYKIGVVLKVMNNTVQHMYCTIL